MSCTFNGPDRYAVICNFAIDTKTASKGTKAFLCYSTMGDPDTVHLHYQSRGGRWITKYDRRKRVENFRVKTIPASHPLYERNYTVWILDTRGDADQLVEFYRKLESGDGSAVVVP